ncbi:MAG: RDD family protein [Elusimicrobia bacterium]|nr:RDD family protein [Elusimicrobiota bacterium]
MASPSTRHLTILLTDIKGFTDKTSHRSRADIQRLLDDHRDVVLPVLQERGGKLVKTIGDAFLMTFESPTDAVLAGVAAQEALSKRNASVADEDRIEIRIAINSGEVNLVEGDVFGEPVNIASRIEGIAEAGEVYFTEAVYLAMNKTEVPSSEVGLLQLKGIPEKIRVYKVRHETPLGVGQVPPKSVPPPAVPGFAPGEKAKLVPPAAPLPAARAASPSSLRRPLAWRRAVAFGIDFVLCMTIAGLFDGGGRRVRVTKRFEHAAAADLPTIKADGKGLTIADGKNTVSMDEKGLRASGADGAKAVIDSSGVRVTPGKEESAAPARNTLYDNGKGLTVTTDEDDAPRHRGKWAFALIWALYGVFCLKYLDGTTPGKKVMKLKVVAEDGSPLTKRQRFARSAFSVVSLYFAFLGYLWALWEKDRRGWHDLLAGTRVVPLD